MLPAAPLAQASEPGVPPCSSTACARRATGASAISPTSRDLVEQWGAAGATSSASIRCTRCSRTDPARASPYSPSSRLFLNVLYIDVDGHRGVRATARSARERVGCAAVPGASSRRCARAARRLCRRRRAPSSTSSTACHAHARDAPRRRTPASAAPHFDAFKAAQGERCAERRALSRRCRSIFGARIGAVWGWPAWPADRIAIPTPRAVPRFADAHADRVDFFAWLQWQASLQRAAVAARGRAARRSPSASTRTSPCRSIAAAPRPGRRQALYAVDGAASARRRTSSTAAARTGDCRR